MKTAIVLLLLIIFCAGCTTYRPMIDTKGVDMNSMEMDLGECQQYAKDMPNGAGRSALLGAAAGAGAGYGVSRAYGVSSNPNMKAGALVGAITGAVAGARAEVEVIKNCMRGRGYSVLQ